MESDGCTPDPSSRRLALALQPLDLIGVHLLAEFEQHVRVRLVQLGTRLGHAVDRAKIAASLKNL